MQRRTLTEGELGRYPSADPYGIVTGTRQAQDDPDNWRIAFTAAHPLINPGEFLTVAGDIIAGIELTPLYIAWFKGTLFLGYSILAGTENYSEYGAPYESSGGSPFVGTFAIIVTGDNTRQNGFKFAQAFYPNADRNHDTWQYGRTAPNTPNTCLLYTSPSPRD